MITRGTKQSQAAWAQEPASAPAAWRGIQDRGGQSQLFSRSKTGDFSPTLLATFIEAGKNLVATWKPTLSAKERATSIAAPANRLLEKLGCPGCTFDAIAEADTRFSAKTWTVILEEKSLVETTEPAHVARLLGSVGHEIYHAYQRYLSAMFLLETTAGPVHKNLLSELSLSSDIALQLLDKHRSRQQARITLTESQRREAVNALSSYRQRETEQNNRAADTTRANYKAALGKLKAAAKKGVPPAEYDVLEAAFTQAWREYAVAQLIYEGSPIEVTPYAVLDEIYAQLGIPLPETAVELRNIAASIMQSMREIWTLSRRR